MSNKDKEIDQKYLNFVSDLITEEIKTNFDKTLDKTHVDIIKGIAFMMTEGIKCDLFPQANHTSPVIDHIYKQLLMSMSIGYTIKSAQIRYDLNKQFVREEKSIAERIFSFFKGSSKRDNKYIWR